MIDVDGVLRDFAGSLVRVYLREHPGHKVKPITSRKLEDFFPIGNDIHKFMNVIHKQEILEDAPAYPDAIEALKDWTPEFEYIIATSQSPEYRAPTLAWLAKFDVPANEIHITFNKQEVAGVALLDDFVDNLEVFQATGRLAICLDQPWNEEWTGPRVKTVGEFLAQVLVFVKNLEGDIDEGVLLA